MGSMRRVGLGMAIGLILPWVQPARADDRVPPPPPPPDASLPVAPAPAGLTAARVPVPDVRGRSEQDAMREIAAAGLRVGGVERVSVARLQAELGQRYTIGLVVQQAPPPSTGASPSWSARGTEVWLRVAAATDEGTVRVPAPAVPATPVAPLEPVVPTVPVPQPSRPTTPLPPTSRVTPAQPSYPLGSTPPRPPPPYPITGSALPSVTPQPMQPMQPVAPLAPLQPAPQPLDPIQPAPQPFDPVQPPPTASDLALLGEIRSSVSLPCERRRGRWHARGLGGGTFWFGTDKGDPGWYAGLDLGHTFSGCFGVDAYYRFSSGTFDRTLAGGRLEDGGGWHHVGLKGTYMSSFSRSSQFFGWIGLGVGWFTAEDYAREDDGFEGYAELGVGYMASRNTRVRLGVMFHAMDTKATREDPARDGTSRLLWIVAPTLSLELDL